MKMTKNRQRRLALRALQTGVIGVYRGVQFLEHVEPIIKGARIMKIRFLDAFHSVGVLFNKNVYLFKLPKFIGDIIFRLNHGGRIYD